MPSWKFISISMWIFHNKHVIMQCYLTDNCKTISPKRIFSMLHSLINVFLLIFPPSICIYLHIIWMEKCTTEFREGSNLKDCCVSLCIMFRKSENSLKGKQKWIYLPTSSGNPSPIKCMSSSCFSHDSKFCKLNFRPNFKEIAWTVS